MPCSCMGVCGRVLNGVRCTRTTGVHWLVECTGGCAQRVGQCGLGGGAPSRSMPPCPRLNTDGRRLVQMLQSGQACRQLLHVAVMTLAWLCCRRHCRTHGPAHAQALWAVGGGPQMWQTRRHAGVMQLCSTQSCGAPQPAATRLCRHHALRGVLRSAFACVLVRQASGVGRTPAMGMGLQISVDLRARARGSTCLRSPGHRAACVEHYCGCHCCG